MIFFTMLVPLNSLSQVNVTWATISPTTSGISGTYLGAPGLVNVTTPGTGSDITFSNSTSTKFLGQGPWPWTGISPVPVKSMLFSFPEKVIITHFQVDDVNGATGQFNDSFEIVGAGFKNTLGCCSNTFGVVIETGHGSGTQHWYCSDPLDAFSINFTHPTLPTAWLFYSIELFRIPEIGPICLNSTDTALPVTLGGLTGAWIPSSINTSVAGTFRYFFIPGPGQSVECLIPVDITILPAGTPGCCDVDLALSSPGNDLDNLSLPIIGVRHREASATITATNQVGIGDNVFQNGVVYHAGDFVDLQPGFDAINGSQFSAYVEGCSDNYFYKNSGPKNIAVTDDLPELPKLNRQFSIYPNPSNNEIKIVMQNAKLARILIASVDGKTVYENNIQETDTIEIDINALNKGIYIVNVTADDGNVYTKKLIKN